MKFLNDCFGIRESRKLDFFIADDLCLIVQLQACRLKMITVGIPCQFICKIFFIRLALI